MGRRLWNNYAWILAIQAISYHGKLAIHPAPLVDLAEVHERAAIGPIPGELVAPAGILFHGGWIGVAGATLHLDYMQRRRRRLLIEVE